MRVRMLLIHLVVLCSPLISFAQLDQFASVGNNYPDFGAISGTWGHLQFYRPFGVRGIVVDDWRDLTVISPLSGEPFNTDRQGWIPHDPGASLWRQMHPSLTAPADTLAPSTLVNYRQGDGVFKDFTLWYHNSLDTETRYGWTSKLRSHPRVLDATVYDEQRHRFQVNTSKLGNYFQIEAGYDHKVNPLYMLAQDSLFAWYYDDDPQIHTNRWDGSFEWNNLDSNSRGSELFAWVQGGLWEWSGGERRSLSQMAYLSHRFDLLGLKSVAMKMGYVSKEYGGNKRAYQFSELSLPEWRGNHHSLKVGFRTVGHSHFVPIVNAHFGAGPLSIQFDTHQHIKESIWDANFSNSLIEKWSAGLNFNHVNLLVNTWRGSVDETLIVGHAGEGRIRLPWQMTAMFGGGIMDMTHDWIFSKQYINWEVNQEVSLFKEALHGKLKVWGKHWFNTQPGLLDSENFQTEYSGFEGEEVLHLLNYTISGQVSTVIVSFTDQNMLQDELWSQYGSTTWNPHYSIMANQTPNSRFRYLSIVWTFDN
ncbi:MAG: hypothetical protein HN995_04420 [Candidatus Marinimicrobia bacterium]|jgi:hypothetical protein|nr:hypothetical protein [Candidatus Neomarinimicrobiota bacterium]MBT3574709.1 hypothetical protein [Candidatus Neomarinimicrobiota bacterium]MBT3680544.1 hypothetical protein [Candidatus Neomarinimicrobiota bacterium]MBT3951990.1 hypothetical protein [Candidatus Neomarinimicrobiota bacterium]MBT4252559.1 hypothetical protein [Candidatus Neomarinimicrobiota bacterium]